MSLSSRKSLRITAGFGVGLLNDARHILPRPTPLPWQRNLRRNTLQHSARIENIAVTLAPSRRYSWVGYWIMSDKFYNDQPPLPLPWQRNLRQNRVTRLVWEISLRCLRLPGGSQGQAIQWCQSNFKKIDPVCHSNKIWDKIGYNAVCKTANINVKTSQFKTHCKDDAMISLH